MYLEFSQSSEDLRQILKREKVINVGKYETGSQTV